MALETPVAAIHAVARVKIIISRRIDECPFLKEQSLKPSERNLANPGAVGRTLGRHDSARNAGGRHPRGRKSQNHYESAQSKAPWIRDLS